MGGGTSGRLTGRIALVTGAGRGVGRGIALACASEGADVVVTDIKLETAAAVAEEVQGRGTRAIAVECDVRRRADVEHAVAKAAQELGPVCILVNNAIRAYPGKPLEDVTDEELDLVWAVGVRGTLYGMQAVFPTMKERGGSIVNLGSRAGIDGSATMGPYAAVKEAIRALTGVAAREWGRYGIRVNTIVPYASSPSFEHHRRLDPEHMERRLAQLPLGRVGDCEDDVGRAAAYLASDDAQYVTGHTLMVDGGSCTF